ncbi:MAG TPA: trehalose-phosphatase, partial [Bryobacteraceae bacterium]
MRHLFDCWPQVVERLRAAGSVALFLDFDGTLVPFEARPEDVWLSRATRKAMARLAVNRRCHLRIISGRRRADLQTRTGLIHVRHMGL